MADISYAYREDRSCSGFFMFTQTGVEYADTGIVGHKHYAAFDQGGWLKSDDSGQSSYGQQFDAATSRVSDTLTSVAAGTYKLRRRLLIPRDFGSFLSVSLFTHRNAVTITGLTLTLTKAGVADPILNEFAVIPTNVNEWQAFSEEPTGNYVAGDFVTLTISCAMSAAGVVASIADWALLYKSGKVNA